MDCALLGPSMEAEGLVSKGYMVARTPRSSREL